MMMIIQLAQFSHNFVIDSCLHSLTQMELCFLNWQSHKGANRLTIKKQQFAWQASPLDIIIKVYINSSQEFHAYLTLLSSIFFHTSKCAFCKRRVVHAAWIFLTLEKNCWNHCTCSFFNSPLIDILCTYVFSFTNKLGDGRQIYHHEFQLSLTQQYWHVVINLFCTSEVH